MSVQLDSVACILRHLQLTLNFKGISGYYGKPVRNDNCFLLIGFWKLLLFAYCFFVPCFRESVGTLNLIRPSVSPSWSVTKTLTFPITFEPLKVGLSYFTCTFLMMRPCHSYQHFDLVTLTLTFDLHILKFNTVGTR